MGVTSLTTIMGDRREPYVLLAIVSAVWGLSSFLVHTTVATIPPASAAAGRLVVGAIALAALARMVKTANEPQSLWHWGYAKVAFFGQALPFFLISWAQVRVTPSTASVLIATTPVFASVFALRQRGVHAAGRTWVGVVLGLAGLTGFIGSSAWSTGSQTWLRDLALAAAALSFAFSGRLVGRLPSDSALTRGANVARHSAAMMVAASLVFDHPWAMSAPSAESLCAMVFLALLSTCVAYVAYYRLIAIGGLPMATSHHYIAPVIALAIQFWWTGTIPTPLQFISVGAILAAVALIAQRPATTAATAPTGETSLLSEPK